MGRLEGQTGEPESEIQSETSAAFRLELGSSFLSLFASLRANSGSIFRWIGMNGYRLGMRATGRGGRLRKGAMLDVKAD
jgi:hypothetical protein